MPSALTHPGVYIEEIPGGLRTITRVANPLEVLAGWAPIGPADQPGLVPDFADFTRKSGSLKLRMILSLPASLHCMNPATLRAAKRTQPSFPTSQGD